MTLMNSDVSTVAMKFEFIASLDLNKEKNKSDNKEQAIEIFADSEMTTVHWDGLPKEEFFKMLTKILSFLFLFSSQDGLDGFYAK